ncbi:hypothetical protein ZYGR_0P01930 [Zygosaccharomyces rouxii]|uniref:Uncharacterized protein n=1 Tax=Zygosaccharomyces rouxii TaxID=4956 RepID=A0A1Q3A1L3_ZYGRO|nr:hypothetical protein ZYGR_0P01930 [Zygosaccharomyces rouxii]
MLELLHAKFIIGILVYVILVDELNVNSFVTNKCFPAYRFKERYIRLRRGLGHRIGLNDDFADDLESGLSSRHFDITSRNASDERHGLDPAAKEEIRNIMERENMGFDKARLLYTERVFGQNNIAPDGTPLDPKAITFQ